MGRRQAPTLVVAMMMAVVVVAFLLRWLERHLLDRERRRPLRTLTGDVGDLALQLDPITVGEFGRRQVIPKLHLDLDDREGVVTGWTVVLGLLYDHLDRSTESMVPAGRQVRAGLHERPLCLVADGLGLALGWLRRLRVMRLGRLRVVLFRRVRGVRLLRGLRMGGLWRLWR